MWFITNKLQMSNKKKFNYLSIRTLRITTVPWVGIEPTLPKELDFESSASTNSATKAKESKVINNLFVLIKINNNAIH